MAGSVVPTAAIAADAKAPRKSPSRQLLIAAAARARPAPPDAELRYSVATFLALDDYTHTTSNARVAFVLCATPLPGLLAALVPSLLPLAPLRDGPTLAFYAHLAVMMVLIAWGSIIPVLSVARVPTSLYSLRDAASVSMLCALLHVGLISVLFRHWRFPVPFLWVVGASFWTVSLIVAHVLVLRAKCWRHDRVLLAALQQNQRGYSLELLHVVLYPAISILFDYVGETYQILLTLLFPVLKVALKRAIQRSTRHLHEHHAVVVVAAVEICASLYQSIVMQSAPTHVAMGITMAIDVAQSVYAIAFFLDRHVSRGTSRRDLVANAVAVLRARPVTQSKSQTLLHALPGAVAPFAQERTVDTAKTTAIAAQRSTLDDSKPAIREALQFVQAAETVVLLEYFEVIVPLINGVFVFVASQFRAARYNTKIAAFYDDRALLASAVASILLYALLQGLSCLVLHVVLQRRYRLSSMYLLAFVLERHRHAIQAKLIAWLPIILHFTTVHYGTDFSFNFDFEQWRQW